MTNLVSRVSSLLATNTRGVRCLITRHAPACTRLVLAVMLCLVLWPQLSHANQKGLGPASYGYFDFPTCVRYALVHSDAFVSSKVDIQLASLNLKDAHSQLIPTLQLLTRYYINRTTSTTGGKGKFNVQLFMTEWNPYLALLRIKSSEILVDIAKTAHVNKISENLAEFAKTFYSIAMLDRSIRANREVVALQRNQVSYGKSMSEQGRMDDLAIRSLDNGLRGAQIRVKTLKLERDEAVAKLKRLMGYPPDHYLPLDTRDVVKQILGGFNGQTVTFPEIQGNNLPLKILAKKEQLQSNYVTGSYVALLPRPVILFEDLQNQVDRTSGFNFAIGLDYTLWDGFRRVREIKRQKLNAREAELRRKGASEQLYGLFRKLRSNLELAGESETHAREEAKLAELAEEKAFLGYKSGKTDYDQYIGKRIDKVRAQLEALKSGDTRVLALIELATIAGGLNRYNAGIRY